MVFHFLNILYRQSPSSNFSKIISEFPLTVKDDPSTDLKNYSKIDCIFSCPSKAQPTVNKRNYICGLGARFGYSRV